MDDRVEKRGSGSAGCVMIGEKNMSEMCGLPDVTLARARHARTHGTHSRACVLTMPMKKVRRLCTSSMSTIAVGSAHAEGLSHVCLGGRSMGGKWCLSLGSFFHGRSTIA